MRLPIISRMLDRRFEREFAAKLAMLLENGVVLNEAIHVLSLQPWPRKRRQRISEVEADLDQGTSFHKALLFARFFSEGFVETIEWASYRGDPNELILALRLLAGDTDYRPARPADDPEEVNLDMFARRLGG